MNRRVRAKRAKAVGRDVSDMFSLYTILQHARSSLHRLTPCQRAAAIRDCARERWGLGLRDRAAKRIARRALREFSKDSKGEAT